MERLKPPQIFSAPSSGRSLTTEPPKIENCSPEHAVKYAAILLGCYRKVDCADPEVFATAAMAVLSRYPEDVARRVTDPHSGLPAKSKWVPTISELRDACEEINAADKRIADQIQRVKHQFAERDRMAAMDPAEKRKAFIKREMAKIDAAFAKNDPEKHLVPDIRGMPEGAEKDALRAKLDASIADRSREFAAKPVTLSPSALSTTACRGVA